MNQNRETGRVKWFKVEKGFGFIEVESGPDIFMHVDQLQEHIESGDLVEFKLKDSKKGPVAIEVKKVVSNEDGTES